MTSLTAHLPSATGTAAAANPAAASNLGANRDPGSTLGTKTATPEQSKSGALGADPKANPGVNSVGGKTLLAQLARPSPAQLLGAWSKSMTRGPVFEPRPGTGSGAVPPLPQRAVVSSPLLDFDRSSPLGSTFGPGRQMRTGPGLPTVSGTLAQTTRNVVNGELAKSNWTARFDALTPTQQEFARGYLSAAIHALEQPAWSATRVTPDEFATLVAMIPDEAQRLQQPPAVPNASGVPTSPSTLPEPLPSSLPEPAARPLPEQTAQPVTAQTVAARTEYPSTGPNDPQPWWWEEVANDPADPQMGAKALRMLVDFRDVKAQIASIDVTLRGPSGQTPMEVWKAWQAA
jgi:hypothetical protein